jgi:hypothetical protein
MSTDLGTLTPRHIKKQQVANFIIHWPVAHSHLLERRDQFA